MGIAFAPDAQLADPGASGPLVPVLKDVVGRERAVRVTVPRALAEVPKVKQVLAQVEKLVGRFSATR